MHKNRASIKQFEAMKLSKQGINYPIWLGLHIHVYNESVDHLCWCARLETWSDACGSAYKSLVGDTHLLQYTPSWFYPSNLRHVRMKKLNLNRNLYPFLSEGLTTIDGVEKIWGTWISITALFITKPPRVQLMAYVADYFSKNWGKGPLFHPASLYSV